MNCHSRTKRTASLLNDTVDASLLPSKWGRKLIGLLLLVGASGWHGLACATEYIQTAFASYQVSYAGASTGITGLELRYGNYLSKEWVLEGVAAFGGDSKTIIEQGPTNGSEDVLGRESSFDHMSLGIELRNLIGVYMGYRKVWGQFDLVARLGMVYLAYNQPFYARNAQINGYQVRYEENVGGSTLGLSLGLGMAYFVTRTGALTLELVNLPSVDDTVYGSSVSGAIQESYSSVKANAVMAGLRFHF